MKIRPYRDSDFPALENILRKTNLYEPSYDNREKYRKHVEEGHPILVATERDQVVGGAILVHTPFISIGYHLAVHPDYQRKGIGNALMKESEKILKEKGAEKVCIYVYEDKKHLLDIYKKKGFVPFPGSVLCMDKELK